MYALHGGSLVSVAAVTNHEQTLRCVAAENLICEKGSPSDVSADCDPAQRLRASIDRTQFEM